MQKDSTIDAVIDGCWLLTTPEESMGKRIREILFFICESIFKGVLHPWTLFLKTEHFLKKNKANLGKESNGSELETVTKLVRYGMQYPLKLDLIKG